MVLGQGKVREREIATWVPDNASSPGVKPITAMLTFMLF